MTRIDYSYSNFPTWAGKHKLCVNKHRDWRMVEPRYGHINGLEHLNGRLMATDGVLCYLEFADESLLCGHIAYFKPNKPEQEVRVPKQKTPTMEDVLKALAED